MALSQDLISKFAKLTNAKKEDEGATLKGTYKKMNGIEYVRLEGSDIWTPVESTVEAEDGEKVKVTIKDHAATIVGNISSPSARTKSVQNLKEEVDEYGNTIQQLDNTIIQQGNSIVQMNNTINQQGNTINQHDNAIHQQGNAITQINNSVNQQNNVIDQMNNTITQHGDNINSMNNTIIQQGNNINQMNNVIQQQDNIINQQSNKIEQQGNIIIQQGNEISQQNNKIDQQGNAITQINDNITSMNNTITQQGNDIYQIDNVVNQQGNMISQQGNTIRQQGNVIEEHNSNITILNSGFKIIDGQLTGLSSAIIDELKTNTLNAEYAKIDFTNINIAAVEELFSKSGIIQDLVVEDQHITGELVGVTIKGDLIEANTLIADKLVIQGDDGLFYKLNMEGSTVSAEQTDRNSLNGSVITAHSVTAEKISVTDLVAFGATIGGFAIGQNSIHSILKTSVNASSPGLYMDSDGQIAFGDSNNHIKYYKDQNDNYNLDVRLHKLYLGSNTQTAEEMISGWIEVSAEGITNKFTSTGGLNLLQNSVGLNGTEWWNTSGTVNTATVNNMTESGSEFILTNNATMYQYYDTITNDGTYETDPESGIEVLKKVTYSVSFKYKHTVNGTPGSCKVQIQGQGDPITILDSTTSVTEWKKVIYQYEALSTQPKIIISVTDTDTNYDIFEITDLIISRGLNDVWSPYFAESIGVSHKLDKKGLYISDYTNTTGNPKNVNLDFDSLIFKQGTGNVKAELSESRVLSNWGEFNSGYKIGKLKVEKIDDNNIIEYIDT